MNNKNWIYFPSTLDCLSFKKTLNFSKEVKKAVIKITSIGWYELFLNNERVNTSVFAPGWTEYKKRVQYQTYDVTKYFNNEVSLVVDLARGWGADNTIAAWARIDKESHLPMCLNFEILVTYIDGSKEKIVSDTSFDVYTNEIVSSRLYAGEEQDCLREIKYLGKAKRCHFSTKLVPQEGPEIIYGERFPAREMFKDNNGDLVIDFGQNMCGIIEIDIQGNKGDVISFTMGEVLDKDGNFYNANYRSAKTTFTYVLNGERQLLRPRFSFLGGRYIKLIKYPEYIKKENFCAVFVHSEMEKTCFFECGNKKIQRLYLNTIYGQLSNYLDVPTDCPQRDERLGWTGDAQVFAKTGAIHFDVSKFFKKWLHDMMLIQTEDGGINSIIPIVTDYDFVNSGWSDSSVIIPFELYKAYGDKKALQECIPMMKKWVMYLSNHCYKPYIVRLERNFGDWLALDKVQDGNCPGLTKYELISTAFFAYSVSLLSYCLKELGEDGREYDELFENIKNAYREEFLENGHMKGEKATLFSNMDKTCYTQTGLALTLHFNLCSEKERVSLAKDLNDLVIECGNKLSTGFLGTPYLLFALSNNGYISKAYDLLMQEEYPSWLYSVNKGATTIWEHYDGIRDDGSMWFESMNSFNHYAYGAVFGWMFDNAVGINILEPGYKKVLIKPHPDKRLKSVKCKFKTRNGNIYVSWKYIKNKILYSIRCTKAINALIELEDGYTIELEKNKKFFYEQKL